MSLENAIANLANAMSRIADALEKAPITTAIESPQATTTPKKPEPATTTPEPMPATTTPEPMPATTTPEPQLTPQEVNEELKAIARTIPNAKAEILRIFQDLGVRGLGEATPQQLQYIIESVRNLPPTAA